MPTATAAGMISYVIVVILVMQLLLLPTGAWAFFLKNEADADVKTIEGQYSCFPWIFNPGNYHLIVHEFTYSSHFK